MRATVSRLALLAVLLLIGTRVHAQDLEPRAYGNAPVGLNFLLLGYAYSEGGLVTDPAIPLDNANLETPTAIAGYARTLGVWGRSAKVAVAVPYAWLSGSADVNGEHVTRDVSGFVDPKIGFTINLYGAPALTMKDFRGYKQKLIIGASVGLSAPFGQYDEDRLVNIGSNRWALKTEVGASRAIERWILELDGAVAVFQDNDDYFGGVKREQDPIYSLQGHVIYAFQHGIWGALDATYYTGGRSTVDGVRNADLQKNSRIGLTVALPINRLNSLKLYFSSGLSVHTGTDFDILGIGWQRRWGGGV